MSIARPTNLREALLMSAARAAGARNTYMAMAAQKLGYSSDMRRMYVQFARQRHHEYLARLREAHAATIGTTVGYYVPEDVSETPARVDTATVPALRLTVRQAS